MTYAKPRTSYVRGVHYRASWADEPPPPKVATLTAHDFAHAFPRMTEPARAGLARMANAAGRPVSAADLGRTVHSTQRVVEILRAAGFTVGLKKKIGYYLTPADMAKVLRLVQERAQQ